MSEDVYAPGETRPKTLALDPMDVPREVWAVLMANPMGMGAAGLGYFAAVLVLVLVALAAIAVGVAPGVLMEDENVLVGGLILGFGVYTLLILGFSFVVFPLMNASLIRAIDAELNGGAPVGFMSLFDTMRENAGKVVIFFLIGQALTLVGMLFFYLPGLVAAVLTSFALPILVLEPEVEPMEAFTRGFEHMKAEPVWHLVVWLTMAAAFLVAELTIVGLFVILPLMVVWQVIAHRQAFPEASARVAMEDR